MASKISPLVRAAVVSLFTAFMATYLLAYFFGQQGYSAQAWLLIGAVAGAIATVTSIVALNAGDESKPTPVPADDGTP